jgi:NADH dehydrogenase
MTTRVVVLGAGYAGTRVTTQLEDELVELDAELTWISREDYHFVLHESHRVISQPSSQDTIMIPISEIKSSKTTFIEGDVMEVHDDEHGVELADGSTVEYDYVVDCLGTKTDFHGVPGLTDHALTLKNLGDALAINAEVTEAAAREETDPAHVVIGGAGLSGIQAAGEIAKFRDIHHTSMEITLVEHSDAVFSGHDEECQNALRERLEARDIEILTDHLVSEADDGTVHFEDRGSIDYDVLLWTGGITGEDELNDPEIEETDDRIEVESTLRCPDDERLFAVGDSALVDLGDHAAPPTAQAAWQAADVAAQNVARVIRGQPLEQWSYSDKGTLVSVGEEAVAHGVPYVPVSTFGGPAARLLKKAVGAWWIGTTSSWRRAARAWPTI